MSNKYVSGDLTTVIAKDVSGDLTTDIAKDVSGDFTTEIAKEVTGDPTSSRPSSPAYSGSGWVNFFIYRSFTANSNPCKWRCSLVCDYPPPVSSYKPTDGSRNVPSTGEDWSNFYTDEV